MINGGETSRRFGWNYVQWSQAFGRLFSVDILRDICPSDSHPGGMKFRSTKDPSVSNYAMPIVI